MFKLSLVLPLLLSLPAAALDACSALNPIEIAATLRGPGVVLAFHSKTDQVHLSTCFLARIQQPGSFAENLSRLQVEAPLTLAVSLADTLGSNGFDLLKLPPQTTETPVAGIGDRAVLRQAAKDEALLTASGSNFLALSLANENPNGKHDQDLIALAREALATNFDGRKVAKYEIAEWALANNRAAFEADPKNFAVLLAFMRRFDEARAYNARTVTTEPNDVDDLYQQGVIDWVASYYFRAEVESKLGLSPSQPLPNAACPQVRLANREKIEEGIAALSKAVKLQPDYEDAKVYLSMMYRERANYECDDSAARLADLQNEYDSINDLIAARKGNNSAKRGSENVLLSLPPPPVVTVAPPPLVGVLPSQQMPTGVIGVIGGVIGSTLVAVPRVAVPTRVRVSAGVIEGLLVKKVDPVYPHLAQQAHIQGTVLLQALIGRDGSIESLSLIGGHPLLVPSAMDAVKQWRYKAYILNGEPVEVDTQRTVNFTLGPSTPCK